MERKKDKIQFTQKEKNILSQAAKNGGVFLKIPQDDSLSQILEADGNGGWKSVKTLNAELDLKLKKLYTQPVPSGFNKIGLKWFVEKYC